MCCIYASVDFPFPFKDGVGMGLDGNILFSNKASRNQWNFVVALPTDIITGILLKYSMIYLQSYY